MNLLPGLVSVSFRELSPERAIRCAADARLKSIEWGGDVHVPHGDVNRAREVQAATADAGLTVASYGSYYRAGESENEGLLFESVLQSALALGAPTIRIWAGKLGSDKADQASRGRVVADTARVADLAATEGIGIAFEYHGNTLTDTAESCADLLDRVARDNVSTYWQPNRALDADANLAAIRAIQPWLSNIHVHHFGEDKNGTGIQPLRNGMDDWRRYLHEIAGDGRDRHLMIEFVKGGEPEQLFEDAAALRELLAELTHSSEHSFQQDQ